ncbi:diaminopimelate decarboxylase [Raineyella antarctica]|uniref:Diaminopimelate decarboxylase n=1 Tax=Raineyella antarctica TaxID=1577474 RepID=A0A1G6GUK3_9ACTN|nr:diaminopimelate decarboxylase [Raineyella antarctica]SDB85702.1 diaminopimelate decarboxylase [Raineyella antarctica]
MTHMHVAGSIHADTIAPGPHWLRMPEDVNALLPILWSTTVKRGDDGVLQVGGLPVTEIAERCGTPVYVLDEDDFHARARSFVEAFEGWDVYYAGKSFLTTAVAGWALADGLFVDCSTGGELAVALRGGVPGQRIGLHGNNKSEAEIEMALEAGVGRIIVDSFDEISRISRAAAERGARPRVMVRVTTGVEAHTHEYIATAHEDQKFGFSIASGQALEALRACESDPHMELIGIHSHIGSQIFETLGFEVAARRIMALHAQAAREFGRQLPEMDLGGGFGIAYTSTDRPESPATLAEALRAIVEEQARDLDVDVPRMSIEPGRAIVGPTTMALYRVGTVKQVVLDGGAARTYISVDGGMSDNIRPALYGAEYSATLASRSSAAAPRLSRIVGKHCEGGDILVRDEFMPADITPGDLVAVPGSGAYSRAMASNYNMVPRPPVVAVKDGRIHTLVRRETIDDLLGLDVGYDPAP